MTSASPRSVDKNAGSLVQWCEWVRHPSWFYHVEKLSFFVSIPVAAEKSVHRSSLFAFFFQENCALRFHLQIKSHSFRKICASAAVFVQR